MPTAYYTDEESEEDILLIGSLEPTAGIVVDMLHSVFFQGHLSAQLSFHILLLSIAIT